MDNNQDTEEHQIEDVKSKIDYDLKMKDFKDKNIVFVYYSPWAKPCKKIEPLLQELNSKHNKQTVIFKVNIDKHDDLADAAVINTMPTFHIFHKGETTCETIIGGEESVIKTAIETISSGKRYTSTQK
eukprot:gene3252-5695_t